MAQVVFKPTKKVAILFGCSNYSKLRAEEGKEAFCDLPTIGQDMKIVKTGLQCLSFMESNIQMYENPEPNQIKSVFNQLIEDCQLDAAKNEKTLIFIYFGGHGAFNMETSAILNGKNSLFPLEAMINLLAAMQNTYVIGLFDSSREQIDLNQWYGAQVDLPEDLGNLMAYSIANEEKSTTNCLITYGAPVT